ncbi:DNA polymerase IV [Neiella marina]|uniref:DNA polymerase IV n=1 Tax=Neiella holothuriorum TaxID=2870530 RepID=A0ABS7ED24_9GAMM|nr:DNA polymerase IV [Neiella holothuriorum]MBW8189622.1 DNA polymerase IV [Neiella holothuriorum]
MNSASLRKIIHIDMDCFFAAVEMREQPALRHLPVAVGGASDRRGVIATCNYEARRYGVRSAMATSQALRLCPNLNVVPGRMALYKDVSTQIHQIFQRYTPHIEPLSLDEAYLDVTDSKLFRGSASLLAEQIRADILKVTGLTASAGIAPNKFLAKVASDLNKPNGQYVVAPPQIAEFVRRLPLEKIPGVGKATLERLHRLNLRVAADVQQQPLDALIKQFGKFGVALHERCFGRDERPVMSERIRKSVGVETTLPDDLISLADCQAVVDELLPDLLRRIDHAEASQRIDRCGVKLKFSDFRQTTVEHKQSSVSRASLLELLAEGYQRRKGKGIRLVGISVGLRSTSQTQLDLPFASSS